MPKKQQQQHPQPPQSQQPQYPVGMLHTRPLPSWYDDAKFGIFVHWGVYAVPAYAPTTNTTSISLNCAEWYMKKLKTPFRDHSVTRNHHNETYGPSVKYEDFAPLWKAEQWNPQQWADLFADSGANYVVFTSKHHDGFCNWPTALSAPHWSVADNGPKKDIVGLLKTAVENKGMKFGLYYSLYEWYNTKYLSEKRSEKKSGGGEKKSGGGEKKSGGKKKKITHPDYVDTVVFSQLKELVQKYEPHILWCDGDWEQTAAYWRTEEFLGWLYNESPVAEFICANDRWGKDAKTKFGCFSAPEDRFSPTMVLPYKWECCMTMGKSWGFNAQETDDLTQTSSELIRKLITTVCFGGNFLLNVGPCADGTISAIQQQRLADIGAWMKINGEAIYHTKPCKFVRDKKNKKFWYTQKKDESVVYGFLLSTTSSPPKAGTIKNLLNSSVSSSSSSSSSSSKRTKTTKTTETTKTTKNNGKVLVSELKYKKNVNFSVELMTGEGLVKCSIVDGGDDEQDFVLKFPADTEFVGALVFKFSGFYQ